METLETEVIAAKEDQCLIIMELDANAKIGKEFCKGDPHNTSKNGKNLLNLVNRQGLIIANTQKECQGVITRVRVKDNKTEMSMIDYIVLCDEMATYFEKKDYR